MTRKMWKCLGNLAKWMKLLTLLLQFAELDKSLGNVYARTKAQMNSAGTPFTKYPRWSSQGCKSLLGSTCIWCGLLHKLDQSDCSEKCASEAT